MKKRLWIEGMTCPNCLKHLAGAFEEIGVAVVASDLSAGTVTVEASGEVSIDALKAVVDEGGYDFVRAEEAAG